MRYNAIKYFHPSLSLFTMANTPITVSCVNWLNFRQPVMTETVAEQLKLPGFFHRAAKIQTLMFFPLYCRRCCLLIISIVLWISASYQGSANIQSSTAPPPRIAVIATQSSESSLTRDIASFLNLDLQWYLSVNELANFNVVRKDQSLTLYAQP